VSCIDKEKVGLAGMLEIVDDGRDEERATVQVTQL
jgi:hypothetical protein